MGDVPEGDLDAAPIRSRRLPRCGTCGLFVALCGCSALPRIETRIEVLVVLHRLERFKSSNTGKLAARMLARSEVAVAGAGDPPRTAAGSYVLFPRAGAVPLREARDLCRLVVPDGTWPQAGKLARRDPRCAGLPAVTLVSTPTSRYGLRRSARPGALATFEAIAEALRVLEGDAVADAMLAAFSTWVAKSAQIRRGAHLAAR
jgi:DTW domain-containing protein YfiP